ncbi:MAG: GIY-YIG nuclease family protein [Lachnospiraceae bacterium]|nr:GIY-YIG nuclease family protein [Lachnospiraceae bacterium]
MSTAKAKTINLLLYEGDLGGVISIEDSSWNSGELYSSPRDSVSDLLDTDACNKYGVYLLLSKDKVYVGQSSDLAKRITQHTIGKDWWESVVILTTKDDSLNHSDIDYLETILIEKAQKINRLDCDNRKKGNNPKVDKFRRVFLSQYLDEALFLMQLIGVTVFSETKSGKHNSNGTCLINTINESAVLAQGKRAKNEAVSVIEKTGFVFYHKVTYATLQPSKQAFWANPSANLVNSDWNIILNDTEHSELIVLQIPASTLQIRTDSIGLVTRKDAPNRIDLSIDQETLIDTKSGINFSSFVATKVKY